MGVIVVYAASGGSDAALMFGVAEAGRRRTQLHVLATDEEAGVVARRRIEADSDSSLGWRLHQVPDQQNTAHAAFDLATEVTADLIVVGTRRRSPVGKLLLGSMAQDILLGAAVPVVLVKP